MEIGASASSIFGNVSSSSIFGDASASSIIGAGQSSGAGSVQEVARSTVDAYKREINRIRGYKLQLTPSDNQKLAKLQVRIQEIEARAGAGTARPDELDERQELFKEADRIIGKSTIDVDADEELAELASGIETLLLPKLAKPQAERVAALERLIGNLENKLTQNPDNRTVVLQLQSASRILAELQPRRAVSELSKAETRSYNDLVELVNERAGAKVELTAKEAIKVAELQRSISTLQSSLPPDTSQQPTSADVARAYTRLSSL